MTDRIVITPGRLQIYNPLLPSQKVFDSNWNTIPRVIKTGTVTGSIGSGITVNYPATETAYPIDVLFADITDPANVPAGRLYCGATDSSSYSGSQSSLGSVAYIEARVFLDRVMFTRSSLPRPGSTFGNYYSAILPADPRTIWYMVLGAP